MPTNAREAAVSTTTKTFSCLPSPATTPPPPTTSVSPEVDEKDCGLVRSNTVLPAVRTPGSRAAVVPVSNMPLDPRSASDPLLLASRPHCCAWFGSDLSSQRSTAIGRPSAHSALTAWSAAVLAFFVSVERLGMDSGPVRLTMEVNWSGLPVQWGFVVALLAPPPWAPWPELEHAAARQVTTTSPASDTRRSARRADMMTPCLVTPAGFASPETTPDSFFHASPAGKLDALIHDGVERDLIGAAEDRQ